jgi:hypothetical protein
MRFVEIGKTGMALTPVISWYQARPLQAKSWRGRHRGCKLAGKWLERLL